MNRLELSLAPNYVEWGIWEALREILQNARDAHDIGFPMDLRYVVAQQRLEVANRKASLGRETLVLGGTSKRKDDNQRGQFGEGYKLACATLLRQGLQVKILNNTELWEPALEFSQAFNTDVLVMKISPLEVPVNCVKFIITGVQKNDYDYMCKQLLFLRKVKPAATTTRGRIFTDKEHRNKLYVKGIFVGKTPENYKFGYDLTKVDVDRDRRLADTWSLRREVAAVIAEAVATKQIGVEKAYKLLQPPKWGILSRDWGEATALEHYPDQGKFNQMLLKFFFDKEGEDAIPVCSHAEAVEAEHYGLIGVETSVAVINVLGAVQRSFRDVKVAEATDTKHIYKPNDLSQEEINNLKYAEALIKGVSDISSFSVNVVDFKGPLVRGSFLKHLLMPDQINLAKKILVDRQQLLATFVHEVAHKRGDDGTVDHRREEERIFSSIIVNNT